MISLRPPCHPATHALQPLVQETSTVTSMLQLGKAENSRIKHKATPAWSGLAEKPLSLQPRQDFGESEKLW